MKKIRIKQRPGMKKRNEQETNIVKLLDMVKSSNEVTLELLSCITELRKEGIDVEVEIGNSGSIIKISIRVI